VKRPARIEPWVAALLVALAVGGVRAAEPDVLVFAAASTTDAISELVELFEQRGLGSAVASFAASSTLARQVERGAPAHVYVSADPQWMDWLAERGLVEPGSRFDWLGNELVLIAPADGAFALGARGFARLPERLGDGRLALADPSHVPAGRYAAAALRALGLWDALAPRAVRTADVRAALALVERGEADAGIVYATDAAASRRVRVVRRLPEDAQPRIVYPVAMIAGHRTAAAERFVGLLRSAEARALLAGHGFVVIDGAPDG
jgi:molybdate transport system substrate-binding protein